MIYSKQSGKGNTVVLIHGFCESHTIWDTIHLQLANHYHTISIDLPGFGNSDLPTETITIDEIAQQVYQHLKYIGIEQCVIIGHSLGGYIALAIAKEYPGFLTGIGLFHSTAFADTEEKKLNRAKSIKFIEKYGVEYFTNSFVPTLFANSGHPSIPNLLISAAKTPKTTVLKYSAAMMNRQDRTEILKTFSYPILLIAGTEDIAVPFADSESQSKMMTIVSMKS